MDYLMPGIAPPPPSDNVLTRVYANLNVNDQPSCFPMDGNDTLGDCTIAAVAHADAVFSGWIGKDKVMSKQAVVKLHMHLTGGVDSDSTNLMY